MPKEPDSPAVEWMARMRLAFQNAVTEDDMRELTKNLVERAKRGDRESLRLLMTYAMPAPKEPTQHQRLTVQAHVPRPKALPHGNGRVINAPVPDPEEED